MPVQQPQRKTFNRGNTSGVSSGYYSRTLFTWVNPTQSPPNLGVLSDNEWTNDVNGDGIKFLINNHPDYSHGEPLFPSYYWTAGKTIRFRGTFFVDSNVSTDRRFNLRFGLKEENNLAVEWLAIQNNDHYHTFLQGNSSEGFVPVNFHCLLMCGTPDYEGITWFTANGFYKYCIQYNTDSNNNSVIQVPVWTNANGTNGISNSMSTDFVIYPTRLMMNCYDTTCDYVRLQHLTIEELL